MADNKDPIERAIESAESLLAFRAREKSARSEDNDGSGLRSLGSPVQDPEQSLFLSPADQSLVSEGAAFQWPSNKTASSEAILPPQLDDKFSPKQSLHALGKEQWPSLPGHLATRISWCSRHKTRPCSASMNSLKLVGGQAGQVI